MPGLRSLRLYMHHENVVPRLDVQYADGRSQQHVISSGAHVLGRDPMCGILLDDPSASRRHAMLRCDNGQFFVQDLGSKNGTLVNDQRVQFHQLSHMDLISIGSVEVRFVADDQTVDRKSTVVVSDEPLNTAASYRSQSTSLQLNERRLQMIYDLSERLTRLRDRQELLEDAMDICFDMLRFERGAIGLRHRDGRGVEWPVVRNLRATTGELTISRSILGRAMDHGERAVITDVGNQKIDPTVSMVQHGIRSAMCVPLEHEKNILGVLYGDRTTTGTTYSKEDVDFLAGIARQVSIGLINARLLEEQKAKLEYEAELAVAREIQQMLFPRDLPQRENLRIAVLNEPGRGVSGDYYDVIEFGDGRIGFLIADVTGEGVAASLLMANLQGAVRLTMGQSDDVSRLLTEWNRLLYDNTDASKFVTCLVAIIDPKALKMSVVLAGHPPAYGVFHNSGEVKPFSAEAWLPLGVADDATYQAADIDLSDTPVTIFAYTDGVYEAMNPEEELFGEDRMIDVLKECLQDDPAMVIRRMRKAVAAYRGNAPASDDLTMVAVRIGPQAQTHAGD